MTKKQYLEHLTQALNHFSDTVRTEVLEDYEAHFAAGLEDGKTEEEICRELGPIELFIEELSQMESSDSTVSPSVSMPITLNDPAPVTDFHSKSNTMLVLNGLHAEVTLSPSQDQKFHIYYECNGTLKQKMQYRFDWHEEGDTIYASVKKVSASAGFFSSLTTPHTTVKVQIPPYMKGIKVGTSSGDIYASNLSAAFSFNTASGDLHLKSLNGSCLIHTASGDITAAYLNGPCQLSTVSGDIVAEYLNGSYILHSISGDISAKGHLSSCKADTTSGDIDCSLCSDCNISVHTVSGDIDIDSYSGISGNLSSVSGDVELRLNDLTAGYSIDYTTVSGDFDISSRCSFVQKQRRGGHAEIPGNSSHTLTISTTSGDITVK